MTHIETKREILLGMEAAVIAMINGASPQSRMGYGVHVDGWNRAMQVYCETATEYPKGLRIALRQVQFAISKTYEEC